MNHASQIQLPDGRPGGGGVRWPDPENALSALGNSQRWRIVQLLADGKALTAGAVAVQFGRHFDTISKHLRILRKAGILESRCGEDRRQELFYLPAAFRTRLDELDLGFCLFRLPGIRPDFDDRSERAVAEDSNPQRHHEDSFLIRNATYPD